MKRWWPVINKCISVFAYIAVVINWLICMYRHDWTEGCFWLLLWCVFMLYDIKEILDDRL